MWCADYAQRNYEMIKFDRSLGIGPAIVSMLLDEHSGKKTNFVGYQRKPNFPCLASVRATPIRNLAPSSTRRHLATEQAQIANIFRICGRLGGEVHEEQK